MTDARAAAPRPLVLGDLLPGRLIRDLVLIVSGAGLVGIAAQVAVPLPGTPVPVTGQTFAVLLAGAALGTWRAVAAMVLYGAAGLAGVPWFAEHSAGYVGATFGYIVGFVLAAAVVGTLAARGGDRAPLRTLATMTLGTLLIYSIGVPWLMTVLSVGLARALELGVLPFLPGDILKVLLAAGLLPATWAFVRRR